MLAINSIQRLSTGGVLLYLQLLKRNRSSICLGRVALLLSWQGVFSEFVAVLILSLFLSNSCSMPSVLWSEKNIFSSAFCNCKLLPGRRRSFFLLYRHLNFFCYIYDIYISVSIGPTKTRLLPTLGSGTIFFSPPKHLVYVDPANYLFSSALKVYLVTTTHHEDEILDVLTAFS